MVQLLESRIILRNAQIAPRVSKQAFGENAIALYFAGISHCWGPLQSPSEIEWRRAVRLLTEGL